MTKTPKSTPTGRRWGAIIRERRMLLGLSQYELADRLQVRQGAVSAWERGLRIPSRENLARISSELGIPAAAFVYEVAS